MSAIRVHVQGARGRMGRACTEAIGAANDLELCGTSGRGDDLRAMLESSRPDVVVEFTVAAAVEHNVRTILEAGAHVVSGTTGLAPERAAALGELAGRRGLGLVMVPSFALGMVLLQRFCRAAAELFDDVEIVELHHEHKRDAPSGTALHTARQIAAAAGRPLNHARPEADEILGCRGAPVEGIPVHSMRLPGALAHQEVSFGAPGQLLTLRHDTLNRMAFMPGVLLAVRRARERTGLIDSLEAFLDR